MLLRVGLFETAWTAHSWSQLCSSTSEMALNSHAKHAFIEGKPEPSPWLARALHFYFDKDEFHLLFHVIGNEMKCCKIHLIPLKNNVIYFLRGTISTEKTISLATFQWRIKIYDWINNAYFPSLPLWTMLGFKVQRDAGVCRQMKQNKRKRDWGTENMISSRENLLKAMWPFSLRNFQTVIAF